MEILKADQVGRFGKLGKKSKNLLKLKSPQKIRSNWIKQTLALWGKLTVARDGECQWCFGDKCNNKHLSGHHIVARGRTKQCLPSWFDFRNGMTLGWWCHDNIKHDPDGYITARDAFLSKELLTYKHLETIYGVKSSLGLPIIKVMYQQFERECVRKKII